MGNDYIKVFRYFTDESYFLQPLCKAWQKTFVNKTGRAVGSTRTSKPIIRIIARSFTVDLCMVATVTGNAPFFGCLFGHL